MNYALNISGLCKTYPNGVVALKSIDLQVAEGDFFALLGPNGAGKSTAIGIISSLVNKTAGSVRVFGDDLDQDPEKVKTHIGLVPQEFNFNQFESVEEIILNQAGFYGISRKEAYPRSKGLLQKLDLWGKRDAESRQLSGGMKRRLMIARALVHRPRLLILDEPTAGVDIEIRQTMWEFTREINAQGTTIILTTHYLEEAENLCRNIAIINQGAIVEHTAMGQLLRRLHTETFVLDLSDTVQGLDELSSYEVQQTDECQLQVSIKQGQSINALFDMLTRRGNQVISMRNKQNRLEKLFMDMLNVSNNKKEAEQ